MVTTIHSAQLIGLSAELVSVEVDITRGSHSFLIVGLPDKAVEEAKDRISAAIRNTGYSAPHQGSRRIIASLAPAELKKAGAHFDLAITLGYLLAARHIQFKPDHRIFFGELGLDGSICPVKGVLLLTQKAKEAGFKEVYIPEPNLREAALVGGISVFGVKNLATLISHLTAGISSGNNPDLPKISLIEAPKTKITSRSGSNPELDFAEISGQNTVKRGLEIAAAGGHHVAMIGPPGAGKTMLARAFTGILPELKEQEIIEVTSIHSIASQLTDQKINSVAPFRSPHHTASYAAMIGGGLWPKPGEVSLAHRGVLFLDEFPEFDKKVIESLRQPLEDKIVQISGAKANLSFPAHFTLLAAMNPCPCGNWKSQKECSCSIATVIRYQKKISGPIMDRLDLWLEVPAVPIKALSERKKGQESSAMIKKRVAKARNIQNQRFSGFPKVLVNGEMSVKQINELIPLSNSVKTILTQAATRMTLSARAYHRSIKLAQTIADLDQSPEIKEKHILEALQYRPRDILER